MPIAGYSEVTGLPASNRAPAITTTFDRSSEAQEMNRAATTAPDNRPAERPALATTQQRLRRQCLPIVLVTLSSVLALAACGSSGKRSNTSSSGLGPISPNPSSISPSSPPPGSKYNGSPASFVRSQLAAAACIRKHGIPDFPDPTFGAGGAQVNLHVPLGVMTFQQFMLAQKACAKLGLELAGYAPTSTATAAEMAQALAVARCMRAHGVPNWPDPSKTPPSDVPAGDNVTDAVPGPPGGPVFVLPKSIDMEAPAVQQALTACHDN
jgi:hypothetical protein